MKEIVTYLMFDGYCRHAMRFYAEALGGTLHMMTVAECGQPESPEADRIMHSKLSLPAGTLMASDTMAAQPIELLHGTNFSISLDFDSTAEQHEAFGKLGEGGQVTMPLQDTFWGARFGMLTDKFGINWMFNYDKPQA